MKPKNSAVEIQNVVVNHKSRHVKSNPALVSVSGVVTCDECFKLEKLFGYRKRLLQEQLTSTAKKRILHG